MYFIKNFIDLEKFIVESNSGYSVAINYNHKMSLVNVKYDESDEALQKITGSISIDNEILSEELIEKRHFYVYSQFLILEHNDLIGSLKRNYINLKNMSDAETKALIKKTNKLPKYSSEKLQEIIGLSIEQLSKAICISEEKLANKHFTIIELFTVFEYPTPVQLLQYIRKHVGEKETILMNALIMDCNEVIDEYLKKPENKDIRVNLDGVQIQLFVKAVKIVIDYQCVMHLRELMDLLLKDFSENKVMNCFKYQRMIINMLEEHSKN